MQTEDDNTPVIIKKKHDKGNQLNDSVTVTLDKTDLKKVEKSDGEDPKPRIVLTFRSDKSGAKNHNMKIVPNDEKHDEFSPRRSSRTRGKWEWSDDTEASVSPNKEKTTSQPASENDETSDSSHTTAKRATRRRSKDSSDNVLANAIARKEKSFNDTAGPTQRLSRRIKPTAKILANEELRIGLESQNNARLGIQTEKSEEGVRTRRSARPAHPEVEAAASTATKKKNYKVIQDEIVIEDDDTNPESNDDPSAVMKLKHLCELGLKAINTDSVDEEEDDDEEMEIDEEEDEDHEDDMEEDDIDDDSEEVISKLLEADEDNSDEEFICSVGARSKGKHPRRSTRLCSSYGGQDADRTAVDDEEQKEPPRRSSRRSTRYSPYESDREYCPPRKRNRSSRRAEQAEADEEEDSRSRRHKNRSAKEEDQSEQEHEDSKSEAAGGDDGSEAAGPEDDSVATATCLCETESNVYAAPDELTEPVFCQAVECVEGVRVGCSHAARRCGGSLKPLWRAGLRAPYLLLCRLHAALMRRHMCCPTCGLFCTQGVFYQCSQGHLFHVDCGIPQRGVTGEGAGCPHCGVRPRRWLPANTASAKVTLRMSTGNKRLYLPDQREQCTPAYLGFSTLEPSQLDQAPIIPEDLLPTEVDLQRLSVKREYEVDDLSVSEAAEQLYDAIMANETLEQLIPKIKSRDVVNAAVNSRDGGSAVHAACRRGSVAALHALAAAGAALQHADAAQRTPLMLALHELLDKSDKNVKNKKRIDGNSKEKAIEPKIEVKVKVEVKEEGAEDVELKEGDKEEVEHVENEKVEDDKKEDKEEEEPKTEDEMRDEKGDENNSANEILQEVDAMNKPSDENLMNVIRYLLAAGCDVNAQGPEGMSALHIAAKFGSARVCGALLEAGAAVDPRDHGGWTPLVWAVENCHDDVVKLLISHGADAASCDLEGNGVVHWCALAGAAAALRLLLLAAPAAARHANAHRDTPLHVAARQGHYACVVILLARGAMTDVRNSAGELPVDVCEGASQRAIALNMQMARIVGPHAVKILSSDISNGREPFPIPCVNEVDDEPLPDDFIYVTEHVMPEPIAIDTTLSTMQGCSCAEGACGSEAGAAAGEAACACCALSVRAWTTRGRLPPAFPYHDPPMLFECNQTCACHAGKCSNMWVTRQLRRGSVLARVGVFRTRRRGWGLRAEERIPRGSPVAAYRGELLLAAAADARPLDHYMFALDLKHDLLEQCVDKSVLCVDARRYGSAARFINHSCRPTAAPLRVFTATRDLRLPHVLLYATTDLRAGDEITFDYGDKFWSVKSKWMKCECGTPECRYPEKTVDSDS